MIIVLSPDLRRSAEKLTKILSWNVTKSGLFFNIVPFPVHIILLSMLHCLDSIGEEAFILLVQKANSIRYDIINIAILVPSQVCFYMLRNR